MASRLTALKFSFILLLAIGISILPAQAKHAQKIGSATNRNYGKVTLSSQPGSRLDQEARELKKADLDDSRAHNDYPDVLLASVPLATRINSPALFVQLQSGRLCGSAGCLTSVFVFDKGQWQNVLNSVGSEISVLSSSHKGMHSLKINQNEIWIWDGAQYQESDSYTPPVRSKKKAPTPVKTKTLLRG